MTNTKKTSKNQIEYIEKLETTCQSQKQQIETLEKKIVWMMEQIKLSQHKRFGSSSEKSEYDQMSLFNEVEQEADARVAEPDIEEITYKRKKRVGQKDEMLSNLPVETVDYYLPEEEQFCSECLMCNATDYFTFKPELRYCNAHLRAFSCRIYKASDAYRCGACGVLRLNCGQTLPTASNDYRNIRI